VVFEPDHWSDLLERLGPHLHIELLGRWLPRPRAYIHDPFGARPEYCFNVARDIRIAVGCLVAELQRARNG
jgi:hypothetical protein